MTELLIEELSSENVNVLRLRRLCLDNPGLVASDSASIRIRIWILFLLGNSFENGEIDIGPSTQDCMEQHVLEADVRRTRADMEEFRSTSWRTAITNILQRFCLKHSIQYKQGMNEVLAPFIYLQSPPKPSFLPFALFESFLFRYLERYFCLDDSSYLFKSFRLFQLLLTYHDPQLALHLRDNDFYPELYAPQWFLTLYSRTLQIKHVLRLWDMIIAVDDPAFTFFIGLCLLRKRRVELLSSNNDTIPEIISIAGLCLEGEDDVDSVVADALTAFGGTPRCFLRALRLCCVSSSSSTVTTTTATTRNAKISGQRKPTSSNSKGAGSPHSPVGQSLDIAMAEQSVRACVCLTAHELISHIAPMITSSAVASVSPDQSNSSSTLHESTCSGNSDDIHPVRETLCTSKPMTNNPLTQFLVIDLRSEDDVAAMGGGILPKAIRMDPEFLDRPDALDAWVQHFDNMRGCCSICIVDMPPSRLSGVTLWRRLLLGDGDGQASRSLYGRSNKINSQSLDTLSRDMESPYAIHEGRALEDDRVRVAVQLAQTLQQAHFPYVCVLSGGLPALVQQLMSSRGAVEPVMINHDHLVWTEYLERRGLTENLKSYQEDEFERENRQGYKPIVEGLLDLKDMSPIEITTIAYQVAVRMGHVNMEAVLLDKINRLQQFDE